MKVSAPTPPPAPTPVDPGQSALSYINAMADPALQQRLLGVETEFRPQYTALNLQDINQYLTGVGGQPGALDMLGTATQRAGEIQSAANTQQRAADIADVQNLGPAAAAAFKAANPDLYAQLESAKQVGAGVNPYANLEAQLGQQGAPGQIQFTPATAAQMQAAGYTAAMGGPIERVGTQDVVTGLLGQNLYQQALGATGLGQVGQTLQGRAQNLAQSTGQLTADELRNLQQSTRAAYAARGTEMGSASVSAEALGRLTNERQRMMEDLQAASALNQAGQAELTSNRGFQQSVQGADIGRQFGNQQAQLQAALANQGVSAQQSALNQSALNQSYQFGASAQNNAASQNQNALNQFGLANMQGNLATQEANRAFAAQQQQQGFANTALLGQLQAGQTAAERAYQLQLLQAQAGMSFDPMQSILGRSSGSIGVGQQQQGVGAGLTQSMQGPQLFDPNAGINLALQNNANLGNYQSSTYGAQAGAQGAITGGIFSGIGNILGGFLGGR